MASSKKHRTQLSNAEMLEIDRHAHENQLSHVDAAYWYNSAHPRTNLQSASVDTRVWSIGSNKVFVMQVQSETAMASTQHLKPHCLSG